MFGAGARNVASSYSLCTGVEPVLKSACFNATFCGTIQVLRMRPALLTLIGFTVFSLCHSFCPMNVGTTVADHDDVHHGMEMVQHDIQHDADSSACEHCEGRSSDQLALTNYSVVPDVTSIAATPIALPPTAPVEYADGRILRSHLAAASPPVVPEIVRTIVLRT